MMKRNRRRTMPNDSFPLQLKEIVNSRRKLFINLLIISLGLALGRYLLPWPTNWISFAINVLLFIVGVLIAPFAFLTETSWKKILEQKFELHFGQQESPLRTGILFILLPILGVFVLTSSRAPIGLGFLWGISAWYAGEVWQMLKGRTDLVNAYFSSPEQQASLPLRNIFWGYCLYAVILTVGILIL